MSWSFPIGTVKGTVIRIHLTFVLFLVWIGLSHYAQGGQRAAFEGVLFISLLFACVLLHEFGHVFAARRYGVQTPDITLDRKSTRLNSSHANISYAVFCLKKK